MAAVAEIVLFAQLDTAGRRKVIRWKEEGRWVKHQVVARGLDAEIMVWLMLWWVQGLDKLATVCSSHLLIQRSVLVLVLMLTV